MGLCLFCWSGRDSIGTIFHCMGDDTIKSQCTMTHTNQLTWSATHHNLLHSLHFDWFLSPFPYGSDCSAARGRFPPQIDPTTPLQSVSNNTCFRTNAEKKKVLVLWWVMLRKNGKVTHHKLIFHNEKHTNASFAICVRQWFWSGPPGRSRWQSWWRRWRWGRGDWSWTGRGSTGGLRLSWSLLQCWDIAFYQWLGNGTRT